MLVMPHRARRFALVAAIICLVFSATVILVGRSRLDAANATIDRRWVPLRGSLATRYEKLTRLDAVFESAGAGRHSVQRELERLLDRWEQLRRAHEIDVEKEATTADALEKSAGRVVRFIYQSDELRESARLARTITAFMRSEVPQPALNAYNNAVVDYEDTRDSVFWAPAAHLLRYDGRSGLGLFV